jgi:hypothetical protein
MTKQWKMKVEIIESRVHLSVFPSSLLCPTCIEAKFEGFLALLTILSESILIWIEQVRDEIDSKSLPLFLPVLSRKNKKRL